MSVAYTEEWLVIIGFVGIFVALYVSAAFLLLRNLFAPVQARPKLGGGGLSIFVLAGTGLALAVYAFFIEPYSLEITHIRIPVPGLLPTSAPIRIAQISDLHCDSAPRLEDKLPEVVRNERPDLIVFTGDALNSVEGFPIFFKCIKRLQEIAPLVAIKGDWDTIPKLNLFAKAGLGSGLIGPMIFSIRGSQICIVGDPAGLSARRLVAAAPKNMPVILLTHGPDSDVVLKQDTAGINLICCGHTHGGQIALPFYGALISQARTQRKFSAGLNRIGETYIYTNRGIGMEGHFPRVRFCARPEVTIFDLVPGAADDRPI